MQFFLRLRPPPTGVKPPRSHLSVFVISFKHLRTMRVASADCEAELCRCSNNQNGWTKPLCTLETYSLVFFVAEYCKKKKKNSGKHKRLVKKRAIIMPTAVVAKIIWSSHELDPGYGCILDIVDLRQSQRQMHHLNFDLMNSISASSVLWRKPGRGQSCRSGVELDHREE